MNQTWKIIPGFPDYQISDDGQLARATPFKQYPRGYILKDRLNIDGYRVTRLSQNGSYTDVRLSRLVLLAFVGLAPRGCMAAHYDGNKTNDRLENLRWATGKENEQDKTRHGRNRGARRGAEHHDAKLNVQAVLAIRAMGKSSKRLAAQLGVSQVTLCDIIARRTWKHLAESPLAPPDAGR